MYAELWVISESIEVRIKSLTITQLIFAPALHQSQIIFSKIKDNLTTEHAKTVLADPEINIRFGTNNGQNIVLQYGNIDISSVITCMSASDQSNIEGKTYMLIIVDEAQDVSDFKYLKSIIPMAAFYNGTRVLIGTPTITRGFFYNAIETNNKEFASGERQRNHFEYDWKTVVKYNPNYEKHIEMQKRKIGEEADEFKMSYCIAPDTRILTSDLRWIRADSIKEGDILAGFDEEPPKRYAQRRFQKAIVEEVGRIVRPCYKLVFEDGTEVVCSSDHQWLTFTAGSRTEWTRTEDLTYTDRVYRVITPWNQPEPNYELGYLSAAFDGEGNVSKTNEAIGQVCFAQKNNAMLTKVKQYLTNLGFNYGTYENDREVVKLYLIGGRDSYFRFLGTVRPERIMNNFDLHITGTLRYCGHKENKYVHPKLISKEFIGEREVIPIRTSTRTYIAEGLASHNCLKWIFERGMFVDAVKFESTCGNTQLERCNFDLKNICVAGIDLGKRNDSTVVTIAQPDWENPIVEEKSGDGDIKDFVVYDVFIKDWMEIQGDNWNEQYDLILNYLRNFRLERVLIDATGVGSPIYDRLAPVLSSMRIDPIPYVFSTQSKSELFKHFDSQIKAGRFQYPAGEFTQETPEYRHFVEQMISLEKTYNGQHMVCAAPKERNAHDDYPISAALAVMAAKGEAANRPVTEKNNPFIDQSRISSYYKQRNRFTARRAR